MYRLLHIEIDLTEDGECSFYEDHLQDQVIPNANDSLKWNHINLRFNLNAFKSLVKIILEESSAELYRSLFCHFFCNCSLPKCTAIL